MIHISFFYIKPKSHPSRKTPEGGGTEQATREDPKNVTQASLRF